MTVGFLDLQGPGLGSRRARVILLREERRLLEAGRTALSYSELGRVWASVGSGGDRASERGERFETGENLSFTIHFAARYRRAKRLIFKKRVFEILSVDDVNAEGQSLVLTCRGISEA